jgi:hypothetical protein
VSIFSREKNLNEKSKAPYVYEQKYNIICFALAQNFLEQSIPESIYEEKVKIFVNHLIAVLNATNSPTPKAPLVVAHRTTPEDSNMESVVTYTFDEKIFEEHKIAFHERLIEELHNNI